LPPGVDELVPPELLDVPPDEPEPDPPSDFGLEAVVSAVPASFFVLVSELALPESSLFFAGALL
jgi:hypothetical protein